MGFNCPVTKGKLLVNYMDICNCGTLMTEELIDGGLLYKCPSCDSFHTTSPLKEPNTYIADSN